MQLVGGNHDKEAMAFKGMVHLTQDMASGDDFGPPE